MALAAYTFIQTVSITDNNILALVAAANLLCLIGQNPRNESLIDPAKAVAAYYTASSAASSAAYYAYRAAYYADTAAYRAYDAAYAADNANAAANNAAYYAAYATYNAVNTAYDNDSNNLPRALTCAAGLIYLNIYTLLPQ